MQLFRQIVEVPQSLSIDTFVKLFCLPTSECSPFATRYRFFCLAAVSSSLVSDFLYSLASLCLQTQKAANRLRTDNISVEFTMFPWAGYVLIFLQLNCVFCITSLHWLYQLRLINLQSGLIFVFPILLEIIRKMQYIMFSSNRCEILSCNQTLSQSMWRPMLYCMTLQLYDSSIRSMTFVMVQPWSSCMPKLQKVASKWAQLLTGNDPCIVYGTTHVNSSPCTVLIANRLHVASDIETPNNFALRLYR